MLAANLNSSTTAAAWQEKSRASREGFAPPGNKKKPDKEEVTQVEGWVGREDAAKLAFDIWEGGESCSVEIGAR